MYQPIFFTIFKLAVLALLGYFLFKPRFMHQHVLKPSMSLVMKVMFPLHFVYNLPLGWQQALSSGWHWLIVFFAAVFVMIGLQLWISQILIKKNRILATEQPKSMTALFSMHNAGFIPLPIMAALAPPEVSVYMFMYVLGFNVIFWSAAYHLVSDDSHGFVFRINPPLIGILAGLLIAVFKLFQYIPDFIMPVLELSGTYTLDLMMVLLGAVLGTIPKSDFQYRPEFGHLILIRFVLYPAVFVAIAALLPLGGLPAELQWGLRLGLVVQAAVPPATNIMLAAKLYGNTQQVHYIGTGILLTYLFSLISLPVFLTVATILFR